MKVHEARSPDEIVAVVSRLEPLAVAIQHAGERAAKLGRAAYEGALADREISDTALDEYERALGAAAEAVGQAIHALQAVRALANGDTWKDFARGGSGK